jgi:hypothetical protein
MTSDLPRIVACYRFIATCPSNREHTRLRAPIQDNPTLRRSDQMIPGMKYLFLGLATIPFIYYLIALFSAWQFFL